MSLYHYQYSENYLNLFKCPTIEDMLKFSLHMEYSGAIKKKKKDGKVPVTKFKKQVVEHYF